MPTNVDAIADLMEAAAAFRDSLVPRADKLEHGEYPLWYGWALHDAFVAGVRWQAFDADRELANEHPAGNRTNADPGARAPNPPREVGRTPTCEPSAANREGVRDGAEGSGGRADTVTAETEGPDAAPRSAVPRRAVVLDLSLQADRRHAMVRALCNIADRIDRGELTRGASGGYDSGYTYHYEEHDHPTHEEYAQQLKDWQAARSGD